jgi:hypothetical protein
MKIVKLNAALTAVFVVITVLAVVVFNSPLRRLVAIVDLVLFAIGVATFIWGYFSAVQRSRSDEISVAGLFLLIDGVASKSVMRVMNSALAIQVTVGLGGAIIRRSTDGVAGSTLAFGVLVPLLGLGLNGLWASKYGSFGKRILDQVSAPEGQIGKDGEHG